MNRNAPRVQKQRTLMKKITKKLALDRQTIALLGTSQLIDVIGGQKPQTKNTQCGDDCTSTSPTQFNLC